LLGDAAARKRTHQGHVHAEYFEPLYFLFHRNTLLVISLHSGVNGAH
jgi:hypothetical protein